MKKLTALGMDIFAGLFTYGVKKAGYEILAQLEHGMYGVKTCRLNFPKLDVRVGKEQWKPEDFKKKVNFMYCNPPCAAWSTARSGQGGTWEQQTHRLVCVDDCVNVGLAVRPDAWCWESVTNAWRMGRPFVVHQAERWNDAGYHCTVLLQDNQFLGAAQERQRMFLIAHKYPLVWPKLVETTTVAEAWASLPRKLPDEPVTHSEMQPYWKQRLWPMSKRYGGYFRRTHEMEGRGPKKLEGRIPSVLVRRLSLDKAAPVMLASSIRLHPTERRYVNWFEWLALCGLPLDWKTSCGGADSATQELARAVLPPVGTWLGKAVAKGLELPALKTRPSTTLVDLRKPDSIFKEKLFDFDGFTIPPFDLIPPPPKVSVASGFVKKKESSGAPRAPKLGIGHFIREQLKEGKHGDDKILELVHKRFPESKASKADVAWNRGKLKAGVYA
jgi:site-specific DNA-cytosine methylase